MDKNIVHVIGGGEAGDDTLVITVRLSEKCNHKCTYCNEYNNSDVFKSIEYMKDFFHRILSDVSGRNVHFYMHGGEPTIVPGFYDVISEIIDTYDFVFFEVQTNTSRTLRWFKQFDKYAGKIEFSCSYQQHQHRNLESFYEVSGHLMNVGTLSSVDVMLEKGNEEAVMEVVNELKNMGFGKLLHLNYVDFKYNKKYYNIEYLMSDGVVNTEDLQVSYKDGTKTTVGKNALHQNGDDNFNMFKCSAGGKNLVININGDVYYCMSHKAREIPKFNLYSGNEITKVISKPWILCSFGRCYCEVYLEKVRVGWER